MSSVVILLKSNLWQRLVMVSKTFCGSVVARMKITFSGGSSSVFKSALKAWFVFESQNAREPLCGGGGRMVLSAT